MGTKFTVLGAETNSTYWIYTAFPKTAVEVRKNLQIQEQSGLIVNFAEETWNLETDSTFSNKPIKP